MLWLIENIDRLDPEAVLALLPRLSPARREKTLRYKVQPPKLQSILAELLLRYALKQEFGMTELPEIGTGEKGKPFFPDHPELQFNLSHCKTAVACALDASPVGVDVQETRCVESGSGTRGTSLMKGIYSDEEKAWVLAGETEAEQEGRFTAVWTCKEAYGKAIGEGILYGLSKYSFLPQPEPWTQEGSTFQTWRRGRTWLTLCALKPLPLRTVSFSELTEDTVEPAPGAAVLIPSQRNNLRGEPTMFDVKTVTEACVQWIRDFFEVNGPGCNAVLGISGGKDSSVAAALCVEALGRERVIGVLMPNGEQHDIDMAHLLCEHLGIENYVVNIHEAVEGVKNAIPAGLELSTQSLTNLPPRIRMATVYAVSQSRNGRVVNTCNLSEDWVGYSTRYGDAAGDFSPMSHLTVDEVKQVGRYLGLPDVLVDKVPIDGLCGKTDEDNLGFTYAVLDRYIRTGEIDDPEAKERIDRLHRRNLFKLQLMPSFDFGIPTRADE